MSGKERNTKRQRASSTSMTSTCTTFPSSNCHHHIMNMFSNTMHFQYCSLLFSHYYSHPNSTIAINTTSSIMTSTATQTQTHNTDVKDTQRLEHIYCRMSNKESETKRQRTSSSSMTSTHITVSSSNHRHTMNMRFQTPCTSSVVHHCSLTILIQIPPLP